MGHKRRLALLALVAVALIALYIFAQVPGNWDYVLPRRLWKVANIILAGGAGGCGTVVFQTISNNRILTPSVVGIDSLYVLVQTLVVFVLGAASNPWTNATLHFLLSVGLLVLFSTLLYRGLFRQEHFRIYFVLLVGLIFGVFFQSLSSFLQMLMDPNEFLVLQGRLFASFNTARPELVIMSSAVLVLTLVLARPLAPYLDVLGLGRDHAVNLGVDHPRVLRHLWFVITVLVSVATALVGPITFLGLVVANLAYEFFRTYRHAVLLPGAALISVITLMAAVILVERVFTFTTTVSVIINFAGSLYFLYLVLRESQGP